ncbi:MAG TPA: sigma-70 family RNA polymerase sigma factor, partial [Caulobacteraceae bacterium]
PPDGRLSRAVGSLLNSGPRKDPAVAGGPLSPDEVARFRRTFLPHMDAAYGFARFLSRDATVAEDLVQDAYLRVYQSFSGYRGGDAKAWLLAIVRSCFLTWVRAQRAWGEVTTPEAVETAARQAQPTDTPEDALVRAAEVADVRAAVEALPDPFRETLVLRELQEMSYRDVAEMTGAPIGTVMSRLARGRQLLAQALCGGPR